MPFKLNTPLIKLPKIGPKTATLLAKNDLFSLQDLLYYFPKDYISYKITSIATAQPGEFVVLRGNLLRLNQKRKGKFSFQTAILQDQSGQLTLRWFNQSYLLHTLKPNQEYQVKGQIEIFRNQKQIVNPKLTLVSKNSSIIEPIYPQLYQLKSSWFQHFFQALFNLDLDIPENIPSSILQKHQLIPRHQALKFIHQPINQSQIKLAHQRLAFEELFLLHKQNLLLKHQPKPIATPLPSSQLNHFINSLPFKLTQSQQQAIQEISQDLNKPFAMNRLLLGDVGSGKTVVAASAAYIAAQNHKLTYVMAPTQVLAEQLFQTFQNFLKPHQLKVELLTNQHQPKNSDYHVLVGTHALLFKNLNPNLGLVIIDEQHKFGVEQRQRLTQLKPTPHKLLMTATPIPRTLALTLMSHLDISHLNEKPANRLPVKTYLVPETKRTSAYQWIKQKITQENQQVFVVAPLIENSDNSQFQYLKSATQIHQELQTIFKPLKIGLLHGQLKPAQKTQLINQFSQGKIKILVATTVVEVGIDIPQANIILIESAERFGLAQLHQLRGRVGRSNQQAYCLLFPSKLTPKAQQRLTALTQYHDGAKLAELDMQLRGPGEIWGTQQHGFFKLKLANIFDQHLVETTLQAAKESLTLKKA